MINEQKPPENFIIPMGLVQAIGDYLIKRPYAEVVQLIDALQRLQPAPQPPDAAKENEHEK